VEALLIYPAGCDCAILYFSSILALKLFLCSGANRALFLMNVTYDDRDSVFKYSPGWFLTGTYNATSVGQTGTLASSDITSGVNVTFVFPGTRSLFPYPHFTDRFLVQLLPQNSFILELSAAVEVRAFFVFSSKKESLVYANFFFFSRHIAAYLICVDCDPNDRQFVPIDAVDPTDDGQNPPVRLLIRAGAVIAHLSPQVVLYSQKFSVAGVHEVILMNQPDLAFGGKSQITLDRFELTVPDPGSHTSI
jgi:hypothetical protein